MACWWFTDLPFTFSVRRALRTLNVNNSSACLPFAEIDAERPVHGIVRAQQLVVDLHPRRSGTQLVAKALEVPQILGPRRPRIEKHLVGSALQTAKLREPLKRKFE